MDRKGKVEINTEFFGGKFRTTNIINIMIIIITLIIRNNRILNKRYGI